MSEESSSRSSSSLAQLRLLLITLCLVVLYLTFSQQIEFQIPPTFDIPVPFFPSSAEKKQQFPSTCPALNEVKLAETQSAEFIVINGVKAVNPPDPNRTVLKLPKAKGKLRRDWSYHEPLSEYAKQIQAHQSNCSLPLATFHVDNAFGMGAHIALWSQAICNSFESGQRLRTYNPIWLWLDQTYCDMTVAANKSPLLCYLPGSEFQCGCDEVAPNVNASDPRDRKKTTCALIKHGSEEVLQEFRAATTEFLFHRISPLVIEEAERQVGLIFPNGVVPDDLITVHIRWGDKFWEMKLAVISEYIEAISTLLHESKGHNRTANIFVATEDPKVYNEFQNVTPPGWNVYYDLTVEELSPFRPPKGNRASHMSKNTMGRAGLAGFGSLLVAMEAKLFVLTSSSNWSRLMNHLRTKVINPRCNNCTKMIDLRPGIW